MEEKQRWRLKKCCCLPLRAGALVLAYFNVIVMIFMSFLCPPFTLSVIEAVDVMFEMQLQEGTLCSYADLVMMLECMIDLFLIFALHERKAALIFAYMCYVVVYIASLLLVLCVVFVYFSGFGGVVWVDLIYETFLLLVLYSMRVEILYGKKDTLLPLHEVNNLSDREQTEATTTSSSVKTDNVDADEKTTV